MVRPSRSTFFVSSHVPKQMKMSWQPNQHASNVVFKKWKKTVN
jgi:hypothetical protein